MGIVENFFTALPDSIINLIQRIANEICELVDSFMVPVVQALPELQTPFQTFYRFYTLVDQFFAIQYALLLFGAWIAIALSIALVNWALGLIPTVS